MAAKQAGECCTGGLAAGGSLVKISLLFFGHFLLKLKRLQTLHLAALPAQQQLRTGGRNIAKSL